MDQYATGRVGAAPAIPPETASPLSQDIAAVDGGDGWSGSSADRVISRLESYIQRYPWPTLMVGLGVGYLLSRRMR